MVSLYFNNIRDIFQVNNHVKFTIVCYNPFQDNNQSGTEVISEMSDKKKNKAKRSKKANQYGRRVNSY